MDYCKDCVMRLFNNKHYNLHGVGNPYFGKCIVIPSVDYNAYKNGNIEFSSQVEIIRDELSFTGELNSIYILPLIRCSSELGCKIDNTIYNNCINYFAQDIKRFNFIDIMLLGESSKLFLGINIRNNLSTVYVSSNNRNYTVNYSPLVKYTNTKLFDEFKTNLIKWYYARDNNYSNYNIIKL